MKFAQIGRSGQRFALAVVAIALAGPATAETRTRTIDVGGVARSYAITIPDRAPNAQAMPVVIALHGALGSPHQIRDYMNWERIAQREGVIIVYPAGLGRTWNDDRPAATRHALRSSTADDVAFLTRLADSLIADGLAARRQIYLMGISNGGFMTLRMACEAPERFAGFGVVIGSMPLAKAQTCRWPTPKPVAIVSGTDDRLIPYTAAAAARMKIFGAAELADYWAKRNGCGSPGHQAVPQAGTRPARTSVAIRSWTKCAAGAGVTLVTIDGGGHQAPISPAPARGTPLLNAVLGPRNTDIDTAEMLWMFFKGNGRR